MGTLFRSGNSGAGLRATSRGSTLSMTALVSEANIRYKRSMLRRKSLPKGFCYVCSRVDPSGIFRNPNSHLFQRGFFHKGSCEHFPRAPYTTFVADDIGESIPEEDDELPDNDTEGETETPSIAVTIKRTSLSDNYGKQFYEFGDTRSSMDGSRAENDKNKVFRLPPMFGHGAGSKMVGSTLDTGRLLPVTSEKSFITAQRSRENESEEELIARLNQHAERSEQSITFRHALSSRAESNTDRVRLPAISQTNQVAVPRSPTPGRGASQSDRLYIPSASESLDIKDDFNSATSVSSLQQETARSYRPPSQDVGPLIINSCDGLDPSSVSRPILNDLASLEAPASNRNRPKGGRARERRSFDQGASSASTEGARPGSGHLRYHHRSLGDDVPSQGFVIPKTPSEFERQSGDHTARSSKMFTDDKDLSDSPSLVLGGLSSGGSFCRCASRDRIIQINSRNVELCKHCGKHVHRSAQRSSKMTSGDGDRGQDGSVLSGDSGNTRENMLYGQAKGRVSATDEDYMDMGNILYDEDGRYFASEEGFFNSSSATTSSSDRRYKNAQPFPLVDPGMHREVYLRALNAVQMKGVKHRGDEVGEFDGLKKLSRPVFSYFHLWPFAGKCSECGDNIGLRPNDRPVPKATKKTSLMKHIFGDVKLEEFYPGGPKSSEKKATPRNVIHDKPKQTETKEIKGKSVSLKYKGQK